MGARRRQPIGPGGLRLGLLALVCLGVMGAVSGARGADGAEASAEDLPPATALGLEDASPRTVEEAETSSPESHRAEARQRAGARAGEEPDTNIDRARRHFRTGVRFYRLRDYEAARSEFETAYAIAPNFRILYNTAQASVQLGDYVSALELLRAYLELGGGQIDQKRRQAVELDQQRLRQNVAELWIRSNIEDAEVEVGPDVTLRLPMRQALLVNPGEHRVRVSRVGYLTQVSRVRVAGGNNIEVRAELRPVPVPEVKASPEVMPFAPPPAEPHMLEAASSPAWLGLVTAGTLGAAGTAMHLVAERHSQAHPGSVLGERLRGVSWGLGIAAGAVGVVSGSVLLWRWQADAKPEDPRPNALQVGLCLDECGLAGIVSRGTF